MKTRVLLLCVTLATGLSACTRDDVYRNVYEGARANNDSRKSTPLENPRSDSMSHEQYEKERSSDPTR